MKKILPEAFRTRMATQLGNEYDDFIAAYERMPVRGIRVNTLKIEKERFFELCPWKVRPSTTLDEGFILLDEVEHIGSHPFHIAGMFYVQEPSAMSVIKSADIEPGMRVLDLCAAPGGKSGGIAARLQGKGFLLSNEIVPNRAKQLARNLERLGAINTAVTSAHPEAIASAFPRYFHRVVVDAPCSGEGMFRKDDSAIAEWSDEHVSSCAARQQAILESAEKCVVGGGKLIYSTCTFSFDENEGVTDAFLTRHPEYKLLSARRLYPHTCEGEGHFVAVLEKSDTSNASRHELGGDYSSIYSKPSDIHQRTAHRKSSQVTDNGLRRLNKEQLQIASDFLSQACIFENVAIPFDRLFVFFGKLLYIPFEIASAMLELRVISLGVEIGEFAKGRLKPSHTFFMAAHGFKYRNAINMNESSRELALFLRGNELDLSLLNCERMDTAQEYSRYMPVCVRSCAIGFGKLSDGVLKNHLPKGLISVGIPEQP